MSLFKFGKIFSGANNNRGKFSGSPDVWPGKIWVKDADGTNKRCWKLTESDIRMLDKRAAANKEDDVKLSFFNKLFGI